MKSYIDSILKKEKKPISLERLYHKIEKNMSDDCGSELLLNDEEKQEVIDILNNEVNNFRVIKTSSDNYILIGKTSFRMGRFYADRNGAGKVSVTTSYIDSDNKHIVKEVKYIVNRGSANGAIDGDYVLVDIGNKKVKPKVYKIIERNIDYIPGEVYRIGTSFFVKPIDKRKQALTIALEGEAIEGARVAVSLDKKVNDQYYIGRVVREFNHKDDPNQDILWEAFKHGIDNEFSDESIEQLRTIPDSVRDIDTIGREDLTDWCIFTIDGIDTKDMDDAISCTINKDGNYVLGVHITDVASLIPENSPLDLEAFRKGNSYYLGGSVIPMTPHQISNGIGSLNPYVRRLAISCIMEIDKNGDVVNYKITPSIIKSRLKMTYDKENKILKDNDVDSEYEDYVETLRLMSKLALKLRKNRLVKGSIEFERHEIKALYQDGKVVDFSVRTQDVAENLIQEFMLIANETVDKTLSSKGLPCIHRVHDKPSQEKVKELLRFLSAVNMPFKDFDSERIAHDKKVYQKFVNHLHSCGRLSSLLLDEGIKCMARAKYSPENIGHFGLAKDNYCHFTSPVRRYADLTVHRILWDCVFNKDSSAKKIHKWEKKLPEIAEKTTRMEKISDEAERDVLQMICAGYMEQHIGDEYEGIITGISQGCMTVLLDNYIEGTIRVKDMNGDYVYSPDSFSLVSLEDRNNYYIGDRLRLKLKSSSAETKKIDFTIIEKIEETNIVDANSINKLVKIKAKEEKSKKVNRKK